MESIVATAPSFVLDVILPRWTAIARVRALSYGRDALGRTTELHAAVALDAGVPLPLGWQRLEAGLLRHALFATPATLARVGDAPTLDAVGGERFVLPAFVDASGNVVAGDDGFAIPRKERAAGAEVETMRVAARVAAETGDLVYGPAVAAADIVLDGRLVELMGFSRTVSVFFAWNETTVAAPVAAAMASTLRSALQTAPGTSGIVSVAS